ncbi:glycosyltransferase family 4 protein [Caldicellulosiruptor acetigenus]|uniref:Glycosyl transferase group 1 n=1 Tax=Caldicellulosiruptor acetigenus 6A TaxID=632516 RepID=G2PWB2_9FIRM|nr:glycosyltransferase family 4 protein [Caldicellulosiruptor acetigenus]AEM72856.1 glycosyl transferase group 1 [Caldicellulosiruptor acetigenus 6A]
MNILFITTAFPEDINGHSNIYVDLMNEFKRNGHSVYVITARERRYKKPTEYINVDGLNILKVRTGNVHKTNFIEKGIATILIEYQYIRAINKYFNEVKFDLIIYATPPINFVKVIKFLKIRDKAKTYLLLKDIFPQNAVDLGIIKKNGILYKYYRKKEIELYKISDYIGCMSPKNVEYVIQHNSYLDPKRVEVCPNSIKISKYEIVDESLKAEIRKKYQLPVNSKIFVYGGNLGKPQGIDFLLDIIMANSKREDVFFLIVGSGTEYKRVEKFINENKIENAKIYPYMKQKEYNNLLKGCDAGLVFLDKRFTIPNFPSRILSYMEVGLPIIAATDKNTDLKDIIREGNFGFWCESGDLESFNKIIDLIIKDDELRKTMGFNARRYLEENYSVEDTYKIIMHHFNE